MIKVFNEYLLNELPSTTDVNYNSGDKVKIKVGNRYLAYILSDSRIWILSQGVTDDEQIIISQIDQPLINKIVTLDSQAEIDASIAIATSNALSSFIPVIGTSLPRGGSIPAYIVNKGTSQLYGGTDSSIEYTNTGTTPSTITVPSGHIMQVFYDKISDTWIAGASQELPVAITDGIVENNNNSPVSGQEVFNKTALKNHGKNYINRDALLDNYYINESDGTLAYNVAYKATNNFIKVTPGINYIGNKITRLAYYSQPSETFFISGDVPNITIPTVITPPINGEYIRVSANVDTSDIYLGLQSEYEGLVVYEKILEEGVKAQAVTQEVKDNILESATTVSKVYGKNRIDNNNFVNGYYVNAITGALDINPSYKATTFCYVGDLTQYIVSPEIIHIAKYTDETPESFIGGEEHPVSNIVTRGSEKWVRLSFFINDSFVQLESGNVATAYENFYRDIALVQNGETYIVVEKESVNNDIYFIPLPNTIYCAQGLQYNIFFKNVFVSSFGYNDLNMFDASSLRGLFMSKKYRLLHNAAESFNLNISAYIDGYKIITKDINIVVPAVNNGSGITRKVLAMGDSTINQGHMLRGIKNFFDTDLMNINFVGTRVTDSINHEGRSGWTINDYYQIASTGGYTNPFRSNVTGKFNINTYITDTGVTLSNGDWFLIQLGINDLYSIAYYKDEATAVNIVQAMIDKLLYITNNIHDYNPNIKIGIAITIPPAADQDATALLLNAAQYNKEAYRKIGLKMWWKKLIDTYEGITNIHLVPTNALVDVENNFQVLSQQIDSYNTTMINVQKDDVHPTVAGYYQMGDAYCGIIKQIG